MSPPPPAAAAASPPDPSDLPDPPDPPDPPEPPDPPDPPVPPESNHDAPDVDAGVPDSNHDPPDCLFIRNHALSLLFYFQAKGEQAGLLLARSLQQRGCRSENESSVSAFNPTPLRSMHTLYLHHYFRHRCRPLLLPIQRLSPSSSRCSFSSALRASS